MKNHLSRLLTKADFPNGKFTLYFLAYIHNDVLPESAEEKLKYTFSREAVLELTQ